MAELRKRLSIVVEGEARRVLAEADLQPDPALVADGWERRFIADRERATEMMDLYRQLGFEVCARPVRPEELGDDCSDCQLVVRLNFMTIYTRRQQPEDT